MRLKIALSTIIAPILFERIHLATFVSCYVFVFALCLDIIQAGSLTAAATLISTIPPLTSSTTYYVWADSSSQSVIETLKFEYGVEVQNEALDAMRSGQSFEEGNGS